jgi:hypothetical protein
VNNRKKYRAEVDVTSGQYTALLTAQDPELPVQPAAMLQSVCANVQHSDDVPKAFLVMIPGERIGDAIKIRTLYAVSVYCPSAIEMKPWDSVPYAFDMAGFIPRSRGQQHLNC